MAIIIVNYVFWYANNSISWMLYTNGIIWDYMVISSGKLLHNHGNHYVS